MGICSSSHIIINTRNRNNAVPQRPSRDSLPPPPFPDSVKIISLDGTLQELNQPIKAAHVLTNPLTPRRSRDCFLCSADSMQMGEPPQPVAKEDELDPGQIYFLLPLSLSHYPLSLQDLCLLAIRASTAFGWLVEKEWSSSGVDGKGIGWGRMGSDGLCWTEISHPLLLISK